jgi:hypothetical protein
MPRPAPFFQPAIVARQQGTVVAAVVATNTKFGPGSGTLYVKHSQEGAWVRHLRRRTQPPHSCLLSGLAVNPAFGVTVCAGLSGTRGFRGFESQDESLEPRARRMLLTNFAGNLVRTRVVILCWSLGTVMVANRRCSKRQDHFNHLRVSRHGQLSRASMWAAGVRNEKPGSVPMTRLSICFNPKTL